jgi:hypothetical protein
VFPRVHIDINLDCFTLLDAVSEFHNYQQLCSDARNLHTSYVSIESMKQEKRYNKINTYPLPSSTFEQGTVLSQIR